MADKQPPKRKLLDWQEEFIGAPHAYKIGNAGRRAGKTEAAADICKVAMLFKKGCRIAYMSRTLPHAKEIFWDKIVEHLGPSMIIGDPNEKKGEIKTRSAHGTVSTLKFFGWNAGQAVKIRGQEFDIVIIDEAAYCDDLNARFWLDVFPVFGTVKDPQVYIFSTPNGMNDYAMMVEMAQKPENDEWLYTHKTYKDNKHINLKVVQQAMKNASEDEVRQEWLGEFISFQGLIYKEISDKHIFSKHARAKIVKMAVGIDFGYGQTGTTAIVGIGIDINNNYWLVSEKAFSGDERLSLISDYVASLKPDMVFADPGAPVLVNELRDSGLPMIGVTKGNHSVREMIKIVQRAVASNRLFIEESLISTRGAFGSYFWKKVQPGNEPEPNKANSHFPDAVRYVIATLDGPMKTVNNPKKKKKKVKRKRWSGL